MLDRNLESKEATLNIAKARSGQAGLTIPLFFNLDRLVFSEAYNWRRIWLEIASLEEQLARQHQGNLD